MERVCFKSTFYVDNNLFKYLFFWIYRPNVCIEREEIDDANNKTSNGSKAPVNKPSTDAVIVTDSASEFVADADIDEDGMSSRSSRQFSAHMRTSSCSDEGLTYYCETK